MSFSSPYDHSSDDHITSSMSTKQSHKRYSVRSQAIARKRQAELEERADESTTESEGEGVSEERLIGMSKHKRPRENSLSPPSPTPRSAKFRHTPGSISSAAMVSGQNKGRLTKKGKKAEFINSATQALDEAEEARTGSEMSTKYGTVEESVHAVSSTLSPKRSAPSTPPPSLKRHTSSNSLAKMSPRDLSDLFSPSHNIPSESWVSPTLKRATSSRRMLTKAQSLGDNLDSPSKVVECEESPASRFPPSIPNTPSRTPTRTRSMPITPTRETFPREQPLQPLLQPLLPAAQRPTSGGRAKRVYGGNRTILVEAKSMIADMGTENDDEEDSRETYAELRRKYDVDNEGWEHGDQQEPSLVDIAQARAPIPVADMRSKGENRRFLDELGYLIDGLSDMNAGVSVKRASCVELLRNMQDEIWAFKIHSCGQVERIWEALTKVRGEGDEVIDFSIVVFLGICVEAGVSLDPILLSHGQEILLLLLRNWHEDSPAASLHRLNTPSARSLESYARRLSVTPSNETFDPRVVVILVTKSVVRNGCIQPTKKLTRLIFDEISAAIKSVLDVNSEPAMELSQGQTEIINAGLHILTLWILQKPNEISDHLRASPHALAGITRLLKVATDLVTATKEYCAAMASCVLDSLQIMAFSTRACQSSGTAILIDPNGCHGLLSVIQARKILADTLCEEASRIHPLSAMDGLEGLTALANGEDILCLVLAIFTAAIAGDPELKLGRTVPSDRRPLHTSSALHATLFKEFASLFSQYSSDKSKTGAIVSGYLACILVHIAHHEPDRSTPMSSLLSPDSEQALKRALMSLQDIQGGEGGSDQPEGDVINLALERLAVLQDKL